MPVRVRDIHAALDRVTGSIEKLAQDGDHPDELLDLAAKTVKAAGRIRRFSISPAGLRELEDSDALVTIRPQLLKIARYERAGHLPNVIAHSLLALSALPGGSKWRPTKPRGAALGGKSKWKPGGPLKRP